MKLGALLPRQVKQVCLLTGDRISSHSSVSVRTAEPVTDSASSFRAPHPRLFVLCKRLATRLALIALAALLFVPVLALLVFGTGMLATFGVWALLGSKLPLLALFVGSVPAVLSAFAAVRLLSVLFVPLPEPSGVRLAPEDACDLHRLIESMTWVLNAGRIDYVWVTPEMNAAVLQRRRGFFGKIETHLLIGLPLAHSVTCSQLVAVLAHEFAHLAVQRNGLGKHGALLRAWWLRALDRLGDVFPVMSVYVDRWLRHLYTDMARLARIEEFEADAVATRLVSADLLGETLIEVSLKGQFLLEDYWPRVLAQSKVRAKPLVRPFRDLGLGMTAGFLRASTGEMLSSNNTSQYLHPTNRERLSALHATPRISSSSDEALPSAASHYLEPLLLTLAWVFDRAWWRDVRPDWKLPYRGAHRERKKMRP